MHPINGIQLNKIIVLVLLLFSCGEEKKESDKNKNISSWKNGNKVDPVEVYKNVLVLSTPERKNADPPPQKKDTILSYLQDTSLFIPTYTYPEPQKPWRKRIDSCHFFTTAKQTSC